MTTHIGHRTLSAFTRLCFGCAAGSIIVSLAFASCGSSTPTVTTPTPNPPTPNPPAPSPGFIHRVVLDPTAQAALPVYFVVDGVLSQSPSTQTYSGSACGPSAGVGAGVDLSERGSHHVQAFSFSSNATWDLTVNVSSTEPCAITRLTCPSGTCSDGAVGNFGVVTANADHSVTICVRDYDCEDGDRVRVSIKGPNLDAVVFADQEIANTRVCRNIALPSAGLFSVSMTALNGTGFKGNCSFANVNTGEMTISGATQRWSLAGGAGTQTTGWIRFP